MSITLEQIVEHKRESMQWRRQFLSIATVRSMAADQPPARSFAAALVQSVRPMRIIAEVKRQSPSAGLLRPEYEGESFAPESIARAYEQAGAAAISCLTDEEFFAGHVSFLARIKPEVTLPVIRKDFLIDPWQVYESRAAGADAVLLMAECLEGQMLGDMALLATSIGLDVLIEIHDAAHLERMAHEAGVQVEHGVEFGVAEVRNATEEVIYLCTGGRGREPPEALNLASHPRVLRPQEALAEVHGEVDVLVLGGGPEGCEVADALAARGSKVRIVELRPKVGLGLPSSVRHLLVDRLKEAGVTVHVSRTLAPLPSAGEEVTLLDRKQNSADRVPYPDIIVLAIGVEREEHFDALEDDARVHRLGDARQPATILEAVAEGWRAGREVR